MIVPVIEVYGTVGNKDESLHFILRFLKNLHIMSGGYLRWSRIGIESVEGLYAFALEDVESVVDEMQTQDELDTNAPGGSMALTPLNHQSGNTNWQLPTKHRSVEVRNIRWRLTKAPRIGGQPNDQNLMRVND